MTDRDALKALAEAATPGPWRACITGILSGRTWVVGNTVHPFDEHPPNAAFIASCSPDVVLSLLSELDAAKARAEELEEALKNYCANAMCPVCKSRLRTRGLLAALAGGGDE